MRVRMFRMTCLRLAIAAAGMAASAGLPASAWGDKMVVDPAKGFVWTGDRCVPRSERPYVRIVTEADYEAAIAEYMAFWVKQRAQAELAETGNKSDPNTFDNFAALIEMEIFKGAETETQAKANVRAWLNATIYPIYSQVYCPENITNILAWAERRDAETYARLNPPGNAAPAGD